MIWGLPGSPFERHSFSFLKCSIGDEACIFKRFLLPNRILSLYGDDWLVENYFCRCSDSYPSDRAKTKRQLSSLIHSVHN